MVFFADLQQLCTLRTGLGMTAGYTWRPLIGACSQWQLHSLTYDAGKQPCTAPCPSDFTREGKHVIVLRSSHTPSSRQCNNYLLDVQLLSKRLCSVASRLRELIPESCWSMLDTATLLEAAAHATTRETLKLPQYVMSRRVAGSNMETAAKPQRDLST